MQLALFSRLPLILLLLALSGCAALTNPITRTTDLPYVSAQAADFDSVRHVLDVYAPRRPSQPVPVLVFIHGGNWNKGSKNLYRFLGSRLARKGIMAVTINYRLSPQANYTGMALDAARAVGWVKANARSFGGDTSLIFVSGHSAGGHLAALIAVRDLYFDSLKIANPIKGAILIDAAGLDMYSYLREEQFAEGHTYLQTFTPDSAEWRAASPRYHLHAKQPPLLIYVGGRTYPSITKSTEAFVGTLRQIVTNPHYRVQRRLGHFPMILQFISAWNPRYREIKRFMHDPTVAPF